MIKLLQNMSLLKLNSLELTVLVIIGFLISCTSQTKMDEDVIRESLVQHLGLLSTPNIEKVSCNLQNKLLKTFTS